MEIAVALDGSKRRDLSFYPGDDLVLNLKAYAKDGDSEPIEVINSKFIHGYVLGPELGAEFTVPEESGREPYKITGDVSGQTTTLAFGWLIAGQGYPEVFCWSGCGWFGCDRWLDVWGTAAENIQVKDVGQYYMSQDVEGVLQEVGARQRQFQEDLDALEFEGSDQIGFLQAGPDATPRSSQDKMRDFVNLRDMTGWDQEDPTPALLSAIALGKDVYIPESSFVFSPSNQTQLSLILDSISKLNLDGQVNLRIPSGVYTYGKVVQVRGVDLSKLTITGQTPVTVTVNSVASVVGSTFNVRHWDGVFKDLNYWTITYNVNSSAGLLVGGYITPFNLTGDKSIRHVGNWEITAISPTTVTCIAICNKEPPTAGISGTAYCLSSVVRFLNSSPTGTSALIVEQGSSIGTINNVAFVGTGRPLDDGAGRSPAGYDVFGGFGGVTGIVARDGGTISLGNRFNASCFSGTNITSTRSGSLIVDAGASSSGAGRNNWSAANTGSTQASGVFAGGALIDNFIAQNNSSGFYTNSTSNGANRHCYIASGGGEINATNVKANGAKGDNVNAVTGKFLISGAILDDADGMCVNAQQSEVVGVGVSGTGNLGGGVYSSNASRVIITGSNIIGNTGFDYSAVNAYMEATSYSGSPVFIPAVNHWGGNGGFIKNGSAPFIGFSPNNTTSAARLSDTNHLLIGTGADLGGQSSARLHVASGVVFAGTIWPSVDNAQTIGTATQRHSNVYGNNLRPGAGAVIWTSGANSPEGVVTAVVGSIYTRTNGGAATTLYIKETGTGNTGWVAK